MNSSLIQLLVLAGIAVFLILKLKNVLGTRSGYEAPPVVKADPDKPVPRKGFEVIEGGPDRDITDHVPDASPAAAALTAMKVAEPSFSLTEFLGGARGAYEMIVMAFETGKIDDVKAFLAPEVFHSFSTAVAEREAQGYTVEAKFLGVRETGVNDATFDTTSKEGDIVVRFIGELNSVVKNGQGEVVEGTSTEIKRQRDIWTFSRRMGSDDPNWLLVATEA